MSSRGRLLATSIALLVIALALIWAGFNRPGGSTSNGQRGVVYGLVVTVAIGIVVIGWMPMRAAVLRSQVSRLADGQIAVVFAPDSTLRGLGIAFARSGIFPTPVVMEVTSRSVRFWTGGPKPTPVAEVAFTDLKAIEIDEEHRRLLLQLTQSTRPGELSFSPFAWKGPIPLRYSKVRLRALVDLIHRESSPS